MLQCYSSTVTYFILNIPFPSFILPSFLPSGFLLSSLRAKVICYRPAGNAPLIQIFTVTYGLDWRKKGGLALCWPHHPGADHIIRVPTTPSRCWQHHPDADHIIQVLTTLSECWPHHPRADHIIRVLTWSVLKLIQRKHRLPLLLQNFFSSQTDNSSSLYVE